MPRFRVLPSTQMNDPIVVRLGRHQYMVPLPLRHLQHGSEETPLVWEQYPAAVIIGAIEEAINNDRS